MAVPPEPPKTVPPAGNQDRGGILIQTTVDTNPWMLVCVGRMGSFNFLTANTGSIAVLSPIVGEKAGA